MRLPSEKLVLDRATPSDVALRASTVGYLAFLAFAWGGNYAWTKLALADSGPWAFNALRYLCASIVLGRHPLGPRAGILGSAASWGAFAARGHRPPPDRDHDRGVDARSDYDRGEPDRPHRLFHADLGHAPQHRDSARAGHGACLRGRRARFRGPRLSLCALVDGLD